MLLCFFLGQKLLVFKSFVLVVDKVFLGGLDLICNATSTTTTVLWPLYNTTCIRQHLQLRSGGFCWSEVYCPHALADGI